MGFDRLNSLEGRPLFLEVRGEELIVTGQRIIEADMMATNGVIHVIDTVLELPVECLRNEDCQNDQICDLATGYCIEQPIAGTCADPFPLKASE